MATQYPDTEEGKTKWARAEADKDLKWAERNYQAALREGNQEKIDYAIELRDQAQRVQKLTYGFEGDAAASRYGEQRIKRDRSQDDEEEDKPNDKPGKDSYYARYGLPATFYRDVAATFAGRPVGNTFDVHASEAKQLMHQKNNESARQDMESQDAWQRGTRNEYAEAGKEASFKNDAQNRQQINNSQFAQGTGVARLRKTTEPDIRHWQQYGAQQRQLGQQRADYADLNREQAIRANAQEQESRINSRDYDWDLNDSRRLSLGQGYGRERQAPAAKPPVQAVNPPPPAQKEEQPEPVQHDPASPQKVLNYMTYGADQSSKQYNGAQMDDDAWALWKEWGSPTPLTAEEAAKYGGYDVGDGPLQKAIAEYRPDAWNSYVQATESTRHIGAGNQMNADDAEKQAAIDNMRVDLQGSTPAARGNGGIPAQYAGRNGMPSNAGMRGYACGTDNARPGLAVVGESGPELVNFNGGEQVYPMDYNGLFNEICDERCKRIKARYDNGEGLSDEELMFIADRAGIADLFEHKDDSEYDSDILKGYADNIRNYLYNYKPGSENIDPRIDPNEDHIGPMAQDIEKVNPACVKETPEGVKTVDTARLAMMNAGAIGDLARQMKEFAARLEALNG